MHPPFISCWADQTCKLSVEFNNLNFEACTAAAKSLQLCPTLCDLIDSSPPGSPVPGILQARTLEWGAIAFSATCTATFDQL